MLYGLGEAVAGVGPVLEGEGADATREVIVAPSSSGRRIFSC